MDRVARRGPIEPERKQHHSVGQVKNRTKNPWQGNRTTPYTMMLPNIPPYKYAAMSGPTAIAPSRYAYG